VKWDVSSTERSPTPSARVTWHFRLYLSTSALDCPNENSSQSKRRTGKPVSKTDRMVGRLSLWNMNSRHSKVTDWGLGHVSIANDCTIFDVGCGGGRTLSKLAVMATRAKVYGLDHSEESVAASKRTNARLIREGPGVSRHATNVEMPSGNKNRHRCLPLSDDR